MIFNIINLCKHISIVLFLSLSSVFTICKITNTRIININENKIIEKPRIASINIFHTYISLIIFEYITQKYVDNNNHDITTMILNIIKSSIIIEFIYYILHRILHTSYLYKNFHSYHHRTVNIYPIDSFIVDIIEILFFVISNYMPLFILNINLVEHMIILYFYITSIIIIHSNIISKIHINHHKYYKYNYCIIIPYFDILCNTYKND